MIGTKLFQKNARVYLLLALYGGYLWHLWPKS